MTRVKNPAGAPSHNNFTGSFKSKVGTTSFPVRTSPPLSQRMTFLKERWICSCSILGTVDSPHLDQYTPLVTDTLPTGNVAVRECDVD